MWLHIYCIYILLFQKHSMSHDLYTSMSSLIIKLQAYANCKFYRWVVEFFKQSVYWILVTELAVQYSKYYSSHSACTEVSSRTQTILHACIY